MSVSWDNFCDFCMDRLGTGLRIAELVVQCHLGL